MNPNSEYITFEQEEKMIDDLLIIMNRHIEERGEPPKKVPFDFSRGNAQFSNKNPVSIDVFIKIVKICLSRGYIEYGPLGSGFRFINLTELGRKKALDAMLNKSEIDRETSNINIGNVTVNGSTQIGNNNIQNVRQVYARDTMHAKQGKITGLWKKICEHPMVCSIVGAIICVALSVFFL